MEQDCSNATWIPKRHNKVAIALTHVSWCTSIWGPAACLRQYFCKTSIEMENAYQERSMTLHVMGTAKMPIAYKGFRWQIKGIKVYAWSADACIWCWWTLPHALLVLFHLLHPPTGLCAVSHHRHSGAETNKGFQGATSTTDKNRNYIGIQQQLMHFHPCISPPGTHRTSLGHLVQFFLLRTKAEGMVQLQKEKHS